MRWLDIGIGSVIVAVSWGFVPFFIWEENQMVSVAGLVLGFIMVPMTGLWMSLVYQEYLDYKQTMGEKNE